MHRRQNYSKAAASTPVFRLREFDESNTVDSQLVASTAAGVQSAVPIVLGRARLTPAEASSLHAGSLVVLEQETADPVSKLPNRSA